MLKELWVLEVGAVYYVTLLLFDDSGHKITISEACEPFLIILITIFYYYINHYHFYY